jgi:recombinational DNA repair protein RecT
LITLAKRSGEVKLWRAELVHKNDSFGWINGEINHIIDFSKERGDLMCVYSHVVTKDDLDDYEVMTIDEVEAIRQRSKAGNCGPWKTDFNEMAKKTVMRRHSKRLMLSREFHAALDADDDSIDFSIEAEPIPEPEAKQTDGNKITEPQRKRLLAIAQKNGIDHESLKKYLKKTFNIDSTKDITKDIYKELEDQITLKPESKTNPEGQAELC